MIHLSSIVVSNTDVNILSILSPEMRADNCTYDTLGGLSVQLKHFCSGHTHPRFYFWISDDFGVTTPEWDVLYTHASSTFLYINILKGRGQWTRTPPMASQWREQGVPFA